jgi:hypothetical protein
MKIIIVMEEIDELFNYLLLFNLFSVNKNYYYYLIYLM